MPFAGPINRYQIIFAHNHPCHICAIPSEADKIQVMRLQVLCRYLGFKEVDNFVVTPYDIYSQLQWDTANYEGENKHKCLINRPFLKKEQRETLKNMSEALKYINFGL